MKPPLVKICGVKDAQALDCAIEYGADLLGFVFFARSPRAIAPSQARALRARVRDGVLTAALVVDADDALLTEICAQAAPDLIQLHGGESLERAQDIKRRFGRPLIRAFGVSNLSDLEKARPWAELADMLLFDAKPGAASRPGGNGQAFDWTLLRNFELSRPWLLAGGLTPQNVAQAISQTGAPGVDVSSGVESAPGIKDCARIAAFLQAARSGSARRA